MPGPTLLFSPTDRLLKAHSGLRWEVGGGGAAPMLAAAHNIIRDLCRVKPSLTADVGDDDDKPQLPLS